MHGSANAGPPEMRLSTTRTARPRIANLPRIRVPPTGPQFEMCERPQVAADAGAHLGCLPVHRAGRDKQLAVRSCATIEGGIWRGRSFSVRSSAMTGPGWFSDASRPWRALVISNALAAALVAAALSFAAWDSTDVCEGAVLGLVALEPLLWAFASTRAPRFGVLGVPAQDEGNDEDGNHLHQGEEAGELVKGCDSRGTDG